MSVFPALAILGIECFRICFLVVRTSFEFQGVIILFERHQIKGIVFVDLVRTTIDLQIVFDRSISDVFLDLFCSMNHRFQVCFIIGR